MKLCLALGAVAAASAAGAVGLGPLKKDGLTDGPRKAFYLTLVNPYDSQESFRAYAVGSEDEADQVRVRIVPAMVQVGARQNRRILVIAEDLVPGETYAFRVCAAKAIAIEGMVHARVCSKLSARRLPDRA